MRAVIEAFVPWFDRAAVEREQADVRVELAKSRATREFARQEIMRGSFARASERLGR